MTKFVIDLLLVKIFEKFKSFANREFLSKNFSFPICNHLFQCFQIYYFYYIGFMQKYITTKFESGKAIRKH